MASTQIDTKGVSENDVPMVDSAIAVGEDLEFQRRWWRFERIIWSFFVLVLIADASGLLGRGPLANASGQTPDGSLKVKYERVQRENTSSIMTLVPSAAAIQNGQVRIFASNTILKQFGAQRIIPAPLYSVIGTDGVTYTFPATAPPMTIQIELKPSFIGDHPFAVGIAGQEPFQRKAFVLP